MSTMNNDQRPEPKPAFTEAAIQKALALGNDVQLFCTLNRLQRRQRMYLVYLPALLFSLAMAVLPLLLKLNLLLNSNLAAALWFGLVAFAFCSIQIGYRVCDGAQYGLLNSEWRESANWDIVMQSPGARQVHAAVLATGTQIHWVHRDLMEWVYHQERAAGLFVETGGMLPRSF